MLFKDISYLELWQPFCSVEQSSGSPFVQLSETIFGKQCYEEQFCEIFF